MVFITITGIFALPDDENSVLQAGFAMSHNFSFRRCRPPKVHFFKNLLRSVPNDFLRRFQIRVEFKTFFDLRPFSKNLGSKIKKKL